MADENTAAVVEYDWSGVSAQAVERLRAPKVPDVPAAVVKLAQASYDGVTNAKDPEGEKLHVMRHRFGSDKEAEAFAKHMKNAGLHTTPLTSVSVVTDPDNSGDNRTVTWKAGARRGRQTTV